MSESMRIGLIEVGSNTIRYMVADWNDMTFAPSKIETIKHGMHPKRPSEQAILDVNRNILELLSDARTRGCDELLAYGTAACRTAVEQFPLLLSPSIRVLTPREEAMASWVAGFACTTRTPGTRCTVIDQGNGSTEIVRATWNGENFDNLEFHSADFGSAFLLEAYKADKGNHVTYTRGLIEAMIPKLTEAGLSSDDAGTMMLVGGVATSIGWQVTRSTGLQEYVPAELNGARTSLGHLDKLYSRLSSEYRKDPRTAQLIVDNRRGSGDHILRILSSLPFIVVLANFLKPGGPFFFSGYGVRHGMAFLIQHRLFSFDGYDLQFR